MSVPPNANLVLDGLQGCNVYVSPGAYTPAPSYVGLSPAPMAYDELGPPDEAIVDKWAEGGSGFVYDNRKTPVELNSRHSSLNINPILSNDSMSLLVDLSRRRGDITMRNDPGCRWEDEDDADDIGAQPATLPRVTRLRLVSPKTRYSIEVTSAHGVTVKDVLDKLFACFHTNLDPEKEVAASEEDYWRRTSAYHANVRNQLWGTAPPFLRRVDLLYGEPIFDGLSSDSDLVFNRYGEKDCSVLIMNFTSRSELS